jgi:hypothetical protein
VRRLAQHRRALLLRRVSGPDGSGNARQLDAGLLGQLPDCPARFGEIFVDVSAQRLQRRYVDYANVVRKRTAKSLDDEVVERGEKRGERFAGARWRRNQGVAAFANRAPALCLRGRRLAKCFAEPTADDRMKGCERDFSRLHQADRSKPKAEGNPLEFK